MKRIAFSAALCLLSGAAYGDFELQDPALITEEELDMPAVKEFRDYAVEGAGVKSCESYQADRKENGPMHYPELGERIHYRCQFHSRRNKGKTPTW